MDTHIYNISVIDFLKTIIGASKVSELLQQNRKRKMYQRILDVCRRRNDAPFLLNQLIDSYLVVKSNHTKCTFGIIQYNI